MKREWKKRDEIIDFMVMNSIFPMRSKKGKIYLWSRRNKRLTNHQKEEILQLLKVQTEQECLELRKEVSKRKAVKRRNTPIKKWVKQERPREMLLQEGAHVLSLSKLLAILLRTGSEGCSAEELGRILLNKFNNLRTLDSVNIADMCTIEGIGEAKAIQIKAALELGKRFYRENAVARKQIRSPEEVVGYAAEYYGPYLRDAKKEYFYAVLLDVKNKPIKNVELSKGSISATIVDPREIIKEATIHSASSVILLHNHPSGENTPSSEDIDLTRRICKSCRLVGIKVLDHIVIGGNENNYFSFAREGLMD